LLLGRVVGSGLATTKELTDAELTPSNKTSIDYSRLPPPARIDREMTERAVERYFRVE